MRRGLATTVQRALQVYEWWPLACHGGLQGQIQALQCAAAGLMEPELGAGVGLSRWFVGVTVLPLAGVVQLRMHSLATTIVHGALPLSKWPVLGMTRGTARLNTASTMCSIYGGACTGCWGRDGYRWFVGVVVVLLL